MPDNYHFMKILITSILLVALSPFGYTQNTGSVVNTIKPGDKLIRYDLIKPAHEYYKNVTTDTAGNIMYEFMMENVTTIDQVNKRILFSRSRQIPVGSWSTDTSITDLTFKPVSMYEHHFQRNVHFDMSFGDTLATVKTTRKGVESIKNYPMKSGYFEDNMIEYIFGYLELEKGVTYMLDNFNKDTPSPSDPFIIEYAFDDIWYLAAGLRLNCRVIHFIHGAATGYIWIDKASNKVIKEEGAFKGGIFVVTKM